jgi:hypothetical protein
MVSILIPGGIGNTTNNPGAFIRGSISIPETFIHEGRGDIGGAANTLGALLHILTLKPDRILVVLQLIMGLHT